MTKKLTSGGQLPPLTLPLIQGGEITLGKASQAGNWQVVFIYRGLHCPLCNQYLKRLQELSEGFSKAGAEIVAVSGDPAAKAQEMVDRNELRFPLAYDLSIEHMEELGLYISVPRNPEETDSPFAEPGTFAVNSEGKLHLIEISNTPFNRADLGELLETVEWVRENDYPIRGTYQ